MLFAGKYDDLRLFPFCETYFLLGQYFAFFLIFENYFWLRLYPQTCRRVL